MRADRLLSELLMIQRHGRVRARDLARELEVSVRTIYRDWYSLRVAGVPIITETGPDGGARLYGDWRTELTGLTAREIDALALLAASEPVGSSARTLTTALAKLSAALPAEHRLPPGRIHFDVEASEAALGTLSRAVNLGICVDVEIIRVFDTLITHRVRPIGLVSSNDRWHLVWMQPDDRIMVDPLSAIASAEITDVPFDRPAQFDLAGFWKEHVTVVAAAHRTYVVRLLASEEAAPLLERRFGTDLSRVGPHYELRFDDIIQARSALLPWGGAVEVVAPEALRRTMRDFARQTLDRYE